jgi:hypothetical protein
MPLRWLTASVLLLAHGALLPPAARAQSSCDDLAQQVQSAQQQVDQDRADAQQILQQIAPLVATAPAELLALASQGALPGVSPDAAASFGAIVTQIGAQIATWQAGNEQTASDAYLRDLLTQLAGWEGQYAGLTPVQPVVPSLVQLSNVFSQLDQTVGQAQADLAILDSLSGALQDCQAGASATREPAPDATPPPEEASPGDSGPLCSVGGVSGNSRSDCFQLENDAAFAVWQACTEAYFAAEDEAFRTGGDPPVNTCDGAWNATQKEIQDRWGGSGS